MASASASPIPVRIRVCKRVAFGHTIAVVGVGASVLGGWDPTSKSKAALTWAEGDVWSGEILAERGYVSDINETLAGFDAIERTEREKERKTGREKDGRPIKNFESRSSFSTHDVSTSFKKKNSATLEYKLVALDGEGRETEWQLGDNRIVEVAGGAAGGKISIAVEESWEGGEAAVEVRVEEEEVKAAPVVPKPTAAAPVANAPAPAAFVQKPEVPVASAAASSSSSSSSSAAAAVPKAAAPAPRPWAAAPAPAVPVAVAVASSSPSPSPSPSSSPSKALSSLTVPQLKAALKSAGLPTSGKKAELVARLEKGA